MYVHTYTPVILKILSMKASRKDVAVLGDARKDLADLDVADKGSRAGRAQQVRRAATEQCSRHRRQNQSEEQLALAGAHCRLAEAGILVPATEALHTDRQHANRGLNSCSEFG